MREHKGTYSALFTFSILPYICVTDTVNGLENWKTCIVWSRVKDNLSKQLKLGYFLGLLLQNFKTLGVNPIYFSNLACILKTSYPNYKESGNFEYIVDLQRFLKLHIDIVLILDTLQIVYIFD